MNANLNDWWAILDRTETIDAMDELPRNEAEAQAELDALIESVARMVAS